MSSGHNTRSKGRSGSYREPVSADLPGLYPVHDGSYGVNTLINVDSVGRRRGRPGPLNENDDDIHFMAHLGVSEPSPSHEANAGEDVDEAEVPNETPSSAGVRTRGRRHQERGNTTSGGSRGSRRNKPQNKGSTGPGTQSGEGGPGDVFDDPALHVRPHVPSMANFLPADGDNAVVPPFKNILYRSPDPDALIHNRRPHAPPPSTQPSFYGVPTGFGSTRRAPVTPVRPATVRGYTAESEVFGNAQLRTPKSQGSSLGASEKGKLVTSNEEKIIEDLIRDMRRKPRPGAPDITLQSLDHLTLAEIQAARDLVQDMVSDPDTALKIMDALDEAASKKGRSSPGATGAGASTTTKTTTDDEQRIIEDLIHDMRIKPRPDAPAITLESLDHLSPAEIEAARDLVQDMAVDPDTALKIIDALDEAASKKGHISPAAAQGQDIQAPVPPGQVIHAQKTPSDGSDGLTEDEWALINNLIHNMRSTARPEDSEIDIQPPEGLSTDEIHAIYDLVQDMGKDITTTLKILDALNAAAKKQGSEEQGAETQGGDGQDAKGQGQEQGEPKTPTLDSLNDDEWGRISYLINDMQTGQRPATPGATIQPLGNLLPAEVEAIYGLVQDMGKDVPTTLNILDELNVVAGQQASGQQAAEQQAAEPESAKSTATPNEQPDSMTEDDWRKINYLVHDMRRQPRPDPPEDLNIGDLGNLRPAEIRAIRGLVRDMGKSRATVRRVLAELDNVAKNQPAEEPSATRLFTGTPPAPVVEEDQGDLDNLGVKLPPIIYPDAGDANIPQRRFLGRRGRSFYQSLEFLGGLFNSLIFFLFILTTVWIVLNFVSRVPPPSLNLPPVGLPKWDNVKWGFNKDWSFSGALRAGIGHSLPAWGGGGNKSTSRPDIMSEVIDSVTSKIPEKVFVDVEKGKPKISQDLLHALKGSNRDNVVSAIQDAVREGRDIPVDAITSGLSAQAPEVSSQGWNNWLKQNKDAIMGAVGGEVISREKFMELFNKEIQAHKQEIRRELDAQGTRTTELMRAVEAVRNAAANMRGMTEQQVRAICEAIVRKGLEKARFDAIVDGQIRGYANEMFANQINFFGVGSGAVINPTFQSGAWQPPKDYYMFRSKRWYQRDGYRIQPPLAALSPWTEEAECFCAGKTIRGQAHAINSVAVLMSRSITPQHLVVEHILPGSTLDPEAMPRDIEVWAYIEELNLRNELRTFSEMQFTGAQAPAEAPGEPTLNEGFVKIGHYTYENKTEGDGIQIFKISDQLVRMGAVTQSIIVRAVSNYGSDHTCFYRLRMYGDIQEYEPWKTQEEENDE
ncbi:hypothetical protein GGS26DRAFT_392544 [Hypomontagnella submonticulosa]|nr:hypothetical protein GGS26DRAFT_392544 [Hypomontagnella submonticulosa]